MPAVNSMNKARLCFEAACKSSLPVQGYLSRAPARIPRGVWGRRKPSRTGDVTAIFAAKGTGLRDVAIGSHCVERIRKRDRPGKPIAARNANKTPRFDAGEIRL